MQDYLKAVRLRPGITSTLTTRVARAGRRGAPHVLRKLVGLSRREWTQMVEGQVALLWAQLLVWVRPQGKLVASEAAGGERLVMPDEEAESDEPTGEELRARELALGVTRAAYFGLFRPLCLVRSVALQRLLERHGLRGSLVRVGVRWQDGRFTAHAWVEMRGRVLGDMSEHVARFTELSSINLLR
jgi:Transglutaminase-like superfamily